MGPRKDEGSYWGYEEQGNEQLQCVHGFQLNTNNTTTLCYRPAEQLKWSNENKNGKETSSSLWSRKWSGCALSFDGKKSSVLAMAEVMHLAYQLAVRNWIKSQFCKRNEKNWRKWLKFFNKFRLQPLKVFAPKREGFHSWIISSVFLIYEPTMYVIQHNPARLHNCDETGITLE